MGGRGALSGTVHRTPNYEKATIAESKITKYCLDPTKKHYREFINVGYSKDNPKQLEKDLLRGLSENEAEVFSPNSYGNISITVYMKLGVTTKKMFKTAWQIDKGTNFPRFITAYRNDKKGQ